MLLVAGMTLLVALALDARPAVDASARRTAPINDLRGPRSWQDGPGPIPWPA